MVREPIKRLEEKVLKENLWIFIFKILKRKDEYAYKIREEISRKFGFLAGEVTSYKVLYLLERGGYVKSYVLNGKRYYKLTERGFEQLKKAKKFLKDVYNSL